MPGRAIAVGGCGSAAPVVANPFLLLLVVAVDADGVAAKVGPHSARADEFEAQG